MAAEFPPLIADVSFVPARMAAFAAWRQTRMSAFAPRRNLIENLSAPEYAPESHSRACRHRAAQRARLAWWRWAALLAGGVIVATLQSGCASPALADASRSARITEYTYESPINQRAPAPPSDAAPGGARKDVRAAATADGGNGKVAFHAPEGPATTDDSAASTEAHRLAEQSQRDVDLLMASRRSSGLSAGAADAAATPSPKTIATPQQAAAQNPPPVKREIQWNDSPSRKPEPVPETGSGRPIAMSPPLPPSAPTTAPASSQPDAAALQPDRIRQLTVELARELYAAGAYSEHPLRELTVIAAMGMSDPERKLDPAAIPDLTDDERALLASLQTFFASVGDTLERGSDVHAAVAQAAAALRQSLVHEPELQLPTLALCTRVEGFGNYVPFERAMFLAGAEQKAIVYLEIEDFVSEINQNNEFVTDLSQQLTIFSERDGIPVWHEDWQQATDVTRNKRQDFFTTQVITLPKSLSVGKYTLKVRVRDEKSKAESETSIPFELVADAKLLK
jgi:hypothetical protein